MTTTPPLTPPLEEELDSIILDLAHQGSMFPRGKTINAGMFSEAKTKLLNLMVRERIEELYALQRTNWITNQLYQGKGTIELSTLIEVIDKRIAHLESLIKEES